MFFDLPDGYVPENISAATRSGTEINIEGRPATLGLLHAGTLTLPSGSLVAKDPFTTGGKPFSNLTLQGTHKVFVNIAHLPDQQRVAYAVIFLGKRPPTQWIEAVTIPAPKKNSIDLEYDAKFFSVDSTTACFMDDATNQILNSDPALATKFHSALQTKLNQSESKSYWFAETSLPEFSWATVVSFSSGWGDGQYRTYFGMDDANELACVVIDFDITNPAQNHPSDILSDRGIEKTQQEDFTGAMADFNKALRLNPKNAAAYANRGLLREMQNHLPDAIQDYSEAIKLDPNDLEALYSRGRLLADSDISRALVDLESSLRIASTDWDKRADVESAVAQIKQALES